jgi:aspartyl aminopeptidase
VPFTVFNCFALAFTAAFHVSRTGIATSAVRFREIHCFSSSSYRHRSKVKLNLNDEFNPVFSLASGRPFKNYVAETLGIEAESITDWDLFLIDAQKPAFVGANRELANSRKPDNHSPLFQH